METIADIVKTENIVIEKDQSIASAIEVMYRNDEGVVVVIDEKKIIGILTERDVVGLLDEHIILEQPVQEIAKKKIVGIHPNRSVEYALHILIDNNIRRLVIIDDNDEFVGIVTQEMIINLLEKEHYRVDLKVSQILSSTGKSIVTLPLQCSLEDAVTQMHSKHIGSVLVSDGEKMAGIITERDLVRIVSQNVPMQTPIAEVMSKPVISVGIDDSIETIVNIMHNRHIRRVLVIDEQGSALGVVGTRDIIKNIKGNYGLFIENKLKHTKQALNTISEVIFELYRDDGNDLIQWGNDTALKIFGDVIIDKPVTALIDQEDWSTIIHELEEHGEIKDYRVHIGEQQYMVSCSQHSRHSNQSLILVCKDVTEYEYRLRYEREKRLEREKTLRLLQNVMDQQQNIVVVTDGKEVKKVNKAFLEFFHVESLARFEEKHDCICELFIAHDNYFHLGKVAQNELWAEALSLQDRQQAIVSMIDHATGEPKVFAAKANKLQNGSRFYVVTFSDVTNLQIESQENYYKATHDALTGIYNRVYFSDSLMHKMEMAQRYDSSLSLILFDIDHFKSVNDTYGHLVGDEVLIKLAATIKRLLRKSDSIARWGGEEFVVLLPNTGIEQAELIAENLRQQIEQIAFRKLGRVTSSFGVAELLKNEDEKDFLKRVDEALYMAKSSGRNCVVSG